MTDPVAPTAQEARPEPHGSRFEGAYCRFDALGMVLRPPEFARTRRGHVSARLSVAIGPDRDLDILVRDRDLPSLRARLHGAVPGALVLTWGYVHPPRLHHREHPNFFAHYIRVVSNGAGHLAVPTSPLPSLEPSPDAVVPEDPTQ